MRFLAVCIAGVLACGSLLAQDYAKFHGAWFHARFVEVLRKSGSLEKSLEAVSEGEPLYISVDSTRSDGNISVAWHLDNINEFILRRTKISGAGTPWAIGSTEGPVWVVSVDERAGTYVALTLIDSLEKGTPVVLGKLPSKNQDPMFVLTRMINSACLSGAWTDATGKPSAFSNGLVATLNGVNFPYRLDIDPSTNSVTLTNTKDTKQRYLVKRNENDLTLLPVGDLSIPRSQIVLKKKTTTTK